MLTEENNPRELPANVKSLFGDFLKEFPPAKEVADTKLFLTTEMVYSRLQDHYRSQDYTEADVFDFLKQSGYLYENIGNSDIELRWLIRYKNESPLSTFP